MPGCSATSLLCRSCPASEAESTSGQFFIDDERLHEHGVHDLDKCAAAPGTRNFTPDFFVD